MHAAVVISEGVPCLPITHLLLVLPGVCPSFVLLLFGDRPHGRPCSCCSRRSSTAKTGGGWPDGTCDGYPKV